GRIDISRLVLLHQPAHFINHQPRSFIPQFHVDEAIGDRLELANRLAELLPGASVVNAAFYLAAHGSQTGCQDAGPFPSHRTTENFGATSFASQQSRGRYPAI